MWAGKGFQRVSDDEICITASHLTLVIAFDAECIKGDIEGSITRNK